MHRPVFGASTMKDQTVYRIDYDTTEADGEGETMRMSAASVSPAAASVAPGSRRHAFAETLPLSSRR